MKAVKTTQKQIDAHIESVLRAANIWDHFLNKTKFPQGLNTKCRKVRRGERGEERKRGERGCEGWENEGRTRGVKDG